ncbi:MAG: adenine deaminase [Candidatus Hermodarchaeota archaeon]
MKNVSSQRNLKQLIDCSMGRVPADLVIQDGTLVNVSIGKLVKNDSLAIKGDRIARINRGDEVIGSQTKVIDAADRIISPGFIDAHLHVESSLLTPTEFCRAVIPHGTTTVSIDPHEIVNVLGRKILDILLKEVDPLPLRFLIQVPSCVPSVSAFENTGAVLGASEVKKLLQNPDLIALAEMMNFPGVYSADLEVLQKIEAAHSLNKIIEGHCPGLTGHELEAYLAAGIGSDHESVTAEEVYEKLSKGCKVAIRAGRFANDLRAIVNMVKTLPDLRNGLFVADDRHPNHLVENGHLNENLRLAVAEGLDPVRAIQMVTINPATHFKINSDLGVLAPGKIADIIVLKELTDFTVEEVIFAGRHIYHSNQFLVEFPSFNYPSWILKSIKLTVPKEKDLIIQSGKEESTVVRVIGVKEGSLYTNHLHEKVPVVNGAIKMVPNRDIFPLYVFNRYGHKTIGKGLVKGFGFKKPCAIASTVAHDSHNLICAGTDLSLILRAVKEIQRIDGGLCVVHSKDTTSLPLSYGGLMSLEPLEAVSVRLQNLQIICQELGIKVADPFMTLAFLSLPVIPALKLTDMGLVDVERFKLCTLEV